MTDANLRQDEKDLWARSGNRCAKCRRQLVEEATRSDAESVVGDECHIVSGQSQGPRYDASFPAARLDEPDNLIGARMIGKAGTELRRMRRWRIADAVAAGVEVRAGSGQKTNYAKRMRPR